MSRGRHRAPRQRRQLVVPSATAVAAGGVALAGLAFSGVAAAPGAEAASSQVWDRVAHCESTNNWHINTGNGYYGGLQFSNSTWSGYHGHKYAARADLATRAEQIEVARRVLAKQGANAWPVCGPNAGLDRASGRATSSALPDSAGPASAAAKRAPTSNKSRTKAHRAIRPSASHPAGQYRVRRGDTLSHVAARFHVAGGWHALWKHNRHSVHNPNILRVGQLIRIPA